MAADAEACGPAALWPAPLQAPVAASVHVYEAVLLVLQPVHLVQGLHPPHGRAEGVRHQGRARVEPPPARVRTRVVENVAQDVVRPLRKGRRGVGVERDRAHTLHLVQRPHIAVLRPAARPGQDRVDAAVEQRHPASEALPPVIGLPLREQPVPRRSHVERRLRLHHRVQPHEDPYRGAVHLDLEEATHPRGPRVGGGRQQAVGASFHLPHLHRRAGDPHVQEVTGVGVAEAEAAVRSTASAREVAPERYVRVAVVQGRNAAPPARGRPRPGARAGGSYLESPGVLRPREPVVVVRAMLREPRPRRIGKTVERVRRPHPQLAPRLHAARQQRPAVGRAVPVVVVAELHLQPRRRDPVPQQVPAVVQGQTPARRPSRPRPAPRSRRPHSSPRIPATPPASSLPPTLSVSILPIHVRLHAALPRHACPPRP